MKKIMKWGFIGTGKIAGRFADDLKFIEDAELTGVFSRNSENLKAFCSKYSTEGYSSLPELLSSDIDVIYIATPHSYHREHTLLALNAGKAVLCEKPFALNSQETQEMMELARNKNVFLMEAMWTRFFPATQEVIEIVRSGKIGRIRKIESSFGYQSRFDPHSRIYDPKLGGGSILDVGVYSVAFARMILDENPETIKISKVRASTGVDESASWEMGYSSDAVAIGSSSVREILKNEALITGEKGEIRIPRFWSPREYFLNGIQRTFEFDGLGFQFEAQEVMNQVRLGKSESAKWTLAHTKDVMMVLDKMQSI